MRRRYIRKRARCQRTTVSGVTAMSDCFHFGQDRRTANQNILFNDAKLRTQASEVRPGVAIHTTA